MNYVVEDLLNINLNWEGDIIFKLEDESNKPVIGVGTGVIKVMLQSF